MQKSSWHILSTRPLSKEIVEQASQQGIEIEEASFIETVPIIDQKLQKEIKTFSGQKLTAVFTSMNAVEAVADVIKQKVDWTVYSIGSATQKLVEEKLGVEVKASAAYAAELADKIIADAPAEVYFFCGNIRRDLLPQKLKVAGIKVHESIVYKTIETPKRILRRFDGILFYSPSAVESFFSVNTIDDKTQLFAIGTTTAEALQPYSQKNVIIANSPGKEALVQQAIRYFNKKRNE
ncbi:MAG: uroporphyrinogen-III synthase [Chitinophagaceae bacterium]